MKNLSPGPLNPKVKVRLPNVTAGPVSAPPLPVIILGIGIYLCWFGIRYFESDVAYPTTPVKDILQGKGLTPVGGKLTAQSIAAQNTGAGTGGSQTQNTSSGTGGGNAAIAADAEKYVGHVYIYGGPSNVTGGWDCSSFASWVLGHDLKYQIPGGDWATVTGNGSGHGPTAAGYKSWTGATTVAGHVNPQPGMLCCWDTHVGFISSNGKGLISALGHKEGTVISPDYNQAGPSGEALVIRQVNAVAASGGGGTAQASGGQAGWIAAFLADLGAPASAANLSSLNAWVRAESGNWGNSGSAHGNPFNIGPGKTYASDTAGAKATADLIASSYHLIYMHLKAGQGLLSGCAPDFAKWGTQTTGL